jgi:hypothetical protein
MEEASHQVHYYQHMLLFYKDLCHLDAGAFLVGRRLTKKKVQEMTAVFYRAQPQLLLVR